VPAPRVATNGADPTPPPPAAAPRPDPAGREGARTGFGLGLLKGLATTARVLMRPATTAEYPDVRPELPPRSRGVIALVEENCTVCMLCARECPDWCIYIDSHKETVPATTPGGRERQRNVLDRFAIDFSLCMYCGICIEVCPFDALHWSPSFEYAELDLRDLLHERERLSQWAATVPPPPPLDPAAPDPKELAAAEKAAQKALDAATRPAAPAGAPAAGAAAGAAARAPRAAAAAGERPERPARAPRAAKAAAAPATDPTPVIQVPAGSEPDTQPVEPVTEPVKAAEPPTDPTPVVDDAPETPR